MCQLKLKTLSSPTDDGSSPDRKNREDDRSRHDRGKVLCDELVGCIYGDALDHRLTGHRAGARDGGNGYPLA